MSNMITLRVPFEYGFVIITCVIGPTLTNIFLGGPVMQARKTLNVPYPNLYATPGVHKEADAFNRIQRGHQNFLENIGDFRFLALVGGLKHPGICSVAGLVFCLGSILYQKGYADLSLDVQKARHLKGGPIKWIGFLFALMCCFSVVVSILQVELKLEF